MLFAGAICKGIEGSEWEDLYEPYKEMSKAVGVRKPSESQKVKALWKMKAARDSGEDFCVPERTDNILGKK